MDVLTEAHGSIQVLRHVTELGDRMDFVATADEQLIPPLLYDRDDPATGRPWAELVLHLRHQPHGAGRTRPRVRWPAS